MKVHSPNLFEHHLLWCNHLPNTVEVIATNSKGFLSHFTLVAARHRHGLVLKAIGNSKFNL